MARQDPLFVSSVGRSMSVLEAFDTPLKSLSLTEVSRITALNRSAAQRFLYTWTSLGYLEKEQDSKRFRLTPKILGPGYNYLKSNLMVEVANPLLLDIRDRTGNSVYLGTMDGPNVIYIARFPKRFAYFKATLPGRRVPAFCASGGRAMMACMPDDRVMEILRQSDLRQITPYTITDPDRIMAEIQKARDQGFAIAVQELLTGEISVSAAITDPAGKPMASVHIAAKFKDWPVERIKEELAPIAADVAQMIGPPF